MQSPTFTETFGDDIWNAPYYTPADEIGRLIPLGKRKSSGKRNMALVERNGVRTRMHRGVLHSVTPGVRSGAFREDLDHHVLPDLRVIMPKSDRSYFALPIAATAAASRRAPGQNLLAKLPAIALRGHVARIT